MKAFSNKDEGWAKTFILSGTIVFASVTFSAAQTQNQTPTVPVMPNTQPSVPNTQPTIPNPINPAATPATPSNPVAPTVPSGQQQAQPSSPPLPTTPTLENNKTDPNNPDLMKKDTLLLNPAMQIPVDTPK